MKCEPSLLMEEPLFREVWTGQFVSGILSLVLASGCSEVILRKVLHFYNQVYRLADLSIKVFSIVLDHVRNQICSGSMDGTARVWNLKTGECVHVLTGHISVVGLLGLSPSYLVSASADGTLRVWDPSTGELRSTLREHTSAVTCFQHDEFKIISGSYDALKMWDIRNGTCVSNLLDGVTGVWQVAFKGRWCVANMNDGYETSFRVWDFENQSSGEQDEEWSDDGSIADEDEDMPETLGPRSALYHPLVEEKMLDKTGKHLDTRIHRLSYSFSHKATAHGNGPVESGLPSIPLGQDTLKQWVSDSHPRRVTFAAHGSSVVTCMVISGDRIITASDDHSIHVYEMLTGILLKSLDGHQGGVWALACSKDVLVSGSTDRTIRIWDLKDLKCIGVFDGHKSTIRCLQIVRPAIVDVQTDGGTQKEKWPKRTLIVTGSRDHTLRVWKLPKPHEEPFFAEMREGVDENEVRTP
jgi:WD40 repeat protein